MMQWNFWIMKSKILMQMKGSVDAMVKVSLTFNDGVKEEKDEAMRFLYTLKNGMEYLYKIETKLW